MARYVVLEFEYNDDANMFVGDMLHDGDKVVGVFAKPTQFCGSGGCETGRVKSFMRGKNFGWWVCAGCKKPARIDNPDKLMRHVISQGVNMLDGIKSELASVWTEGWGVMAR